MTVGPIRQPAGRAAPSRNRGGRPIQIKSTGAAIRIPGTGAYVSFWETDNATRRGFIQNDQPYGLYVYPDGDDAQQATARDVILGATGYIRMENHVNMSGTKHIYWKDQNANGGLWMQDGTWVRASPNFYTAGILGGDGGISSKGGGGMGGYGAGYFVGTVGMTSDLRISGLAICDGNIRSYRNGGSAGDGATDANYYNATFYAAPADAHGTSTASISFHPGGVAPQLRVGVNVDTIFVQNSVGTASTSHLSGVLDNTSSRRYKANINTWPLCSGGAAIQSAMDLIMKLRVVTFQFDHHTKLWETPHSGRRTEALRRLNDYARRTGKHPYQLSNHDCDIDPCNGTRDNPCARVIMANKQHFGLVAEEVYEVLPELVALDAERRPEAINALQVGAVAIAGIQELCGRIEALEMLGSK